MWSRGTLAQSPSCGQRQTMNHIVNTCPLTKFDGGQNLLHKADDDAVIYMAGIYSDFSTHEMIIRHAAQSLHTSARNLLEDALLKHCIGGAYDQRRTNHTVWSVSRPLLHRTPSDEDDLSANCSDFARRSRDSIHTARHDTDRTVLSCLAGSVNWA